MRKPIVIATFCCFGALASAQNVGINATGAAPAASAMLDVDATNRGLLVPRVALTAANSNAPIGATVVNSLLVFNTATSGAGVNAVSPGYYYWNSTTFRWVRFSNDGDDWRLLGNAGTVATTNFLGTTDAVALRVRTNNFERFEITTGTGTATGTGGRLRAFQNGTAADPIYSWVASPNAGLFSPAANVLSVSTTSLERMRVLANGQVVVAGIAPFAGDQFTTFGNATNPFAVNGYSGAGGAGVFGQSDAGASDGVVGIAQSGGVNGFGVYGIHIAATGTGVVGAGNNAAAQVLINGSGGAFTGSGVGSFSFGQGVGSFGAYGASGNIASGTGVVGAGNNVAPAGLAAGGGGQFFGNAAGAYGRAFTAASGTGVLGAGNNLIGNVLGGGSGGGFTGTSTGVIGWGTTVASGTGVLGAGNNLATIPLATGAGGQFFGNATGAYGRANTVATGTGVIGAGNNLVGILSGFGGGGSFTGTSIGSFSIATTAASGVGVVGVGNNLVGILPAAGAGGSFVANTQGVYARGLTPATGHGILASGNNVLPATAPDGAGGSLRGTELGVLASATTAASGTGLAGLGNGLGTYGTLVNGSGVAGTGEFFGVYGLANSNADGAAGAPARAGGYFVSGTGAGETFTYVAAYEGAGVPRKVMGDGTVNTVVRDTENNYVLLSAPEAPENLFQDYGTGQLVNGRASITLDPILTKNILVNEQHPLRVFVQLRGDCNGVYVTNETATGFEVIELMGGSSNVKFNWSVTANRANVINANGVAWNYAEERFARTVGPQVISSKTIGIQEGTDAHIPLVQVVPGILPDTTMKLEQVTESPVHMELKEPRRRLKEKAE